ncbi:hypothetical protein Tco_1013915 [Tanacetum coccineum]
MLQDVKSWLGKCFSMKDLGEETYILRIKNSRDRSKQLIALSQSAYLGKILKRFKMENSKRRNILMQEKPNLGKSQGASTPEEVMHMQRVPYALAIGSIMYVMRCTGPDVAFTEKDDRKSKSGYVFVLNGGAIDCKTAKQSTIVMSSTEVEYIVALEAAMEVVWMRNFIDGLGVVPTNNEPMEMLCDNTSTIPIANEPNVIKGARHYQRKFHCIREVIKFGEIVLNKSIYEDSVFNQAY